MSKADNLGGVRVEIARNDGGHLAIEDADRLALRFFTTDISSAAADSYDECAHRTDPTGPFGDEDITPIRTGMRLARLDRTTWSWLVNDLPRSFLRAIDPAWDLVELDDRSWPVVREAMQQALYDFMGAGRGAAVATNGRVVANPFVATREAVSLLKLRARHLVGPKLRPPSTYAIVQTTVERMCLVGSEPLSARTAISRLDRLLSSELTVTERQSAVVSCRSCSSGRRGGIRSRFNSAW